MSIILISYIMFKNNLIKTGQHTFVVIVWLVSQLIDWLRVTRLTLNRLAGTTILYKQRHQFIVIVAFSFIEAL